MKLVGVRICFSGWSTLRNRVKTREVVSYLSSPYCLGPIVTEALSWHLGLLVEIVVLLQNN